MHNISKAFQEAFQQFERQNTSPQFNGQLLTRRCHAARIERSRATKLTSSIGVHAQNTRTQSALPILRSRLLARPFAPTQSGVSPRRCSSLFDSWAERYFLSKCLTQDRRTRNDTKGRIVHAANFSTSQASQRIHFQPRQMVAKISNHQLANYNGLLQSSLSVLGMDRFGVWLAGNWQQVPTGRSFPTTMFERWERALSERTILKCSTCTEPIHVIETHMSDLEMFLVCDQVSSPNWAVRKPAKRPILKLLPYRQSLHC